jgi:23S rRNA (cytosine1962-C5)-methyltransferase
MCSASDAPAEPALPEVRLKILRRSAHPWIYQKMLEKPASRLSPGSVVDILDREGHWVGRGFYNGHSRIALRVLTSDPRERIDGEFLGRRLDRAIALRRQWLDLDQVTDAYRLVHSEGDELSGLVLDRFASFLVLEYFSAGMFRFRDTLRELLTTRFPECRFYAFAEEHIQKQEGFDCRAGDPPPPAIITEHGVRFKVAPGSKHKTGFFADQRENRLALAGLCRDRRVLDLCCNSGGFALYASVRGGAAEVTGIDLDEDALELARKNANLNHAKVRFVQADLFAWLRDILRAGTRFDVVVLDPAKQTRDREAVGLALKRYFDMNRLAIQAVAPGGVFLSCSCTGLIREEDFLEMLRRAAWQAARTLEIFRISGAGPDHPYLIHVPESRYLKAVWARVY